MLHALLIADETTAQLFADAAHRHPRISVTKRPAPAGAGLHEVRVATEGSAILGLDMLDDVNFPDDARFALLSIELDSNREVMLSGNINDSAFTYAIRRSKNPAEAYDELVRWITADPSELENEPIPGDLAELYADIAKES